MTRIAFRKATALAAAACAVLFTTAAQPQEPPRTGLGDRLYPALGDPRIHVGAYDITLDYHGNDKPLDAVTRMEARAVTGFDRFHLDFTHGTVRKVTVDGRPAAFRTTGEWLEITPGHHVEAGRPLRITVTHTSDPSGTDGQGGWVRTADGLALANQAVAAHHVFPCNDHPSDKAFFTFRITTPKGITAVAGGLPAGRPASGGTARAATTTWTYTTAHPVATELAQVSIGRSTVLHRTGPHGLPMRDVVPTADRTVLADRLALTPAQLSWMEGQVGPFPFETYGVLAVNTATGFELETQTLSLFERRLLVAPVAYVAPLMIHELAHQWFGDSVTPAAWSDVWLNEGHATWYEWRYRGEKKYGDSLDAQAKRAYQIDALARAAYGPPARPKVPPAGSKLGIFRENVYGGGALVLYALRHEIGDHAFRELERAWVTEHRDGNVTTHDFVALASRVAGRDLSGFLNGWLYGAKPPAMPGHPDWKPLTKLPVATALPGSPGAATRPGGRPAGRAQRPAPAVPAPVRR
ncbi:MULTISPECIES: M1 family metallopeptidase [Streptomycetaceae]|uniref:Aminopeptidase N n=1 Tax=Streptantibioticus cattleyicolor (strain ATCC 35852 / DSM 46488 / JCM 4925 / NBRC 14057 / NRRL 8057) TaxID=1003195 RepID=F8JUU1_STREN|nr:MULTISPECIES: M1 family metallopeptidase [Streptomycetaceae]AEW96926.1 Peptidase M1 membrane alanine aminopeptidase [Streptantibioticus cattleyicolor NRRL 8057 = DSM 46488]MYS61402.1 M1 family peptidase [Streptomyces sp. SID5468]CCB77255.1 putative Zinc metalloprotease (membrane protein) [Streptantibioticus cattleyicolor NRRL 8057 = DSM 46488]